jgi:hypothetical protein
VIAGIVPTDGVHLTTTPSRPIIEVTFVGAPGKEYVFACAVGTMNESRSAAVTPTTPRADFFEVNFISRLKLNLNFNAK